MKIRILKYFFSIIIVLAPWVMSATHNRAGEITYRQLSPLTIEMTITTYTKASSVAADRDSLEVLWGDGSREWVKRNNDLTRFEPNDIKINKYIANHTYPGSATYTVSFVDPNRIGNILNVNYPNSIDIAFFLSTTFTLLDQQFQGFNNSAILLQPPVDNGCVNKVFIHNPNAYDPDQDSLAYELAVPLMDVNLPVPNYKLPNLIGELAGNKLTINPVTGEIRWDSPKLQGEYNIAIKIKEYRKGKLINVILRDMQILIRACDNEPPIIKSISELCVVAGDKVSIDIEVSDPNTNQKVKITATGGPFIEVSPAVLTGPANFTNVKFNAKLEWQTNCNHISGQYYQIVLKAIDNYFPDSTGLVTLKTIRIKVIGPPPKNLISKSENGAIRLEWDNPYSCDITRDNYFYGFSVWRKIASSNYQPDTCNPGLTKSPFQKISFRTTAKSGNKYFFIDNQTEAGNTYCYRVQAEFAKLTSTSNPYNIVESLPSNESCVILKRDIPLITKVSVSETSSGTGMIHVKWTKPLADQLDTIKNPGPYRFDIYRAVVGGVPVLVSSISSAHFKTIADSNYFDKNLNTIDNQYSYFISFFSNSKKFGDSPKATSVFLRVSPSDKKNILSWDSNTPWSNHLYTIYIKSTSGQFKYLAETTGNSFEHVNLSNDSIYCYRIESKGSYSIPGIEDPILNFSQELCKRPVDNVPSCPPDLKVTNVCERLSGITTPDELFNSLSWTNPFNKCPNISNDIATYVIYYAETIQDSLQKIKEQNVSDGLLYSHYPISGLSGCYALTTIDFNGNESARSNKVCVDNCPFYELPNTFTPNGDGKNDIFKPRINLFIAEVRFLVYNQWGNLVFETTDPEINWDGTTNKGNELSDGTYHYICRVFEKRVAGITERKNTLNGFIHLIRN